MFKNIRKNKVDNESPKHEEGPFPGFIFYCVISYDS